MSGYPIQQPFAAVSSGEACSVTTAYHAKNTVKPTGMSEADWAKHQAQGELGVVLGKQAKGELVDGDYFASTGLSKATIIVKKNKFYWKSNLSGNVEADPLPDGELEMLINTGKWRRVGKKPPPVLPSSQSVGHMSDEDISVLFVKSKDDIASMKGIPIQGSNPVLDQEVYEAIGKITGYTKAEVVAKIDAYKATGKKLSALKKKVMKDDAPYKAALAKAGKKTAAPPVPEQPKVSVSKVAEPPKATPPPTAVPSVASPTAKKEVVDAVQTKIATAGVKYSEEDLVKAYIKAKDMVASDVSNAFTLYSKGPDYDAALQKALDSFMLDVKVKDINNAQASYVASGKKVSALKKKMIKDGDLKPGSPLTPPKPAAQKAAETVINTPPTNSASQADMIINQAIQVGDKLAEKGIALEALGEEMIKEMALYKDMSDHMIIKKLVAAAKKKNMTPGTIIKAYDLAKSKQLGIPNGNFYEKKVLAYLATPTGKESIKQALMTASYAPPSPYKSVPPPEQLFFKRLPKDSELFDGITVADASAMQRTLTPWTADQKASLRTYTGSSYMAINRALRTTGGNPTSMKNVIDEMDKGMRELPGNYILHRGTSMTQLGLPNSSDLTDVEGLIGKTIKDDGYLSTSVGKRAAFGGRVMMEIEAPRGTLGAYVNDISHHKGENELILARSTEMKVIDARQGSGGSIIVRVRVVKQHGKR